MNNNFDPLSRLLNYLNENFKTNNITFFYIVVLVIIGLWIFFTGLYTVAVDEVVVIQRFGKFVRQEPPGLHFKLPDGIEKKTRVKIQKLYSAEFGLRTEKAGIRSTYAPEERYLNESLMLTGDLNCAIVPWVVQFKISNPKYYLFKVRNVNSTLRDLSESSMRVVIGDRSINEVLTEREPIADEAKIRLQNEIDEAEMGLQIVNIELQNTNVPKPVQPSFNEVNQSEQEKKKMILQAREARNKVIPSAKGEADKIISEAEGYALARINKARGDSSRFVAIYNEYRQSKDVTRRRLYLETIGEIIPNLGQKHIIDNDLKGVLPLLNLGTQGGK